MKKVKITVLKKMLNTKLIQEHRNEPGQMCDMFSIGQEFIIDNFEKPEKFCNWAWQDIQKVVLTLLFDGNFADFSPNNPNALITCCTDGLRPVVFKIEKIE